MTAYDKHFYDHIIAGSLASANAIVPLILELIPIESVCDVGCGLGNWLAVFQEQGVTDTLGLDGDHVPRELLQIAASQFIATDLSRPLPLERQFDLVMSLEVAEHLPPTHARSFVGELVRLAPVVLFSAAIPGQGGTGHVNEQWPDYWDEHFRQFGFVCFDALRWQIWDNDAVEPWYQQNMVFYVMERAVTEYPKLSSPIPVSRMPRRLVQPKLYQNHVQPPPSFLDTVGKLPGLLTKAVSRRAATLPFSRKAHWRRRPSTPVKGK